MYHLSTHDSKKYFSFSFSLNNVVTFAYANNFRLKNFWLSNPKSDELICAVVFPFLETLRLDFIFQVSNHSCYLGANRKF